MPEELKNFIEGYAGRSIIIVLFSVMSSLFGIFISIGYDAIKKEEQHEVALAVINKQLSDLSATITDRNILEDNRDKVVNSRIDDIVKTIDRTERTIGQLHSDMSEMAGKVLNREIAPLP
ncbi:MAG: hypothetical protein KGI08_05180 [Thaumarchaeota archaeon]|nr:hypothetical protein [Nitrososphaerota archaeon]